MRFLSAVVAVVILAGSIHAQTSDPSQLPSVALPPELARVLTDYETQWRHGGDSLAQLFTEDAILTVGGRPPVRGRSAIAAHYQGSHGPLALRAIAYAAEGRVGYIIGGFSARRGGADTGKFVLTLRKDTNGRWLIFSDMDTGNAPPTRRPTPPPAG